MKLGALATSLAKTGLDLAAVPLGAAVGFQASLRVACHRRPMPMPRQFSNLLEHPLRMSYRDPAELLRNCGIAKGETVVDVGCGTGVFTVEMARLVGTTGTVHAVDVQPALLNQAEARLHEHGMRRQTHFHLASATNLPFPEASVHMVALIAISGELANPLLCIDEIFRMLKPGGRLFVSEELADPSYVSARTMRRWLTDGGFEFVNREGNLLSYSEHYLKPITMIG